MTAPRVGVRRALALGAFALVSIVLAGLDPGMASVWACGAALMVLASPSPDPVAGAIESAGGQVAELKGELHKAVSVMTKFLAYPHEGARIPTGKRVKSFPPGPGASGVRVLAAGEQAEIEVSVVDGYRPWLMPKAMRVVAHAAGRRRCLLDVDLLEGAINLRPQPHFPSSSEEFACNAGTAVLVDFDPISTATYCCVLRILVKNPNTIASRVRVDVFGELLQVLPTGASSVSPENT